MTIYYPPELPKGLRVGRKYQVVSPLQRSQLTSGRARQRRKYTSVPEMVSISWIFTSTEGQLFEAWYQNAIKDGAEWFECPLKTPLGLENYTCRFTDIYEGPSHVGPELWSYSAELELRERATIPGEWAEFPEFVIHSDIIDIALNRLWPLNAWQINAGTMDTAINEDWPKP